MLNFGSLEREFNNDHWRKLLSGWKLTWQDAGRWICMHRVESTGIERGEALCFQPGSDMIWYDMIWTFCSLPRFIFVDWYQPGMGGCVRTRCSNMSSDLALCHWHWHRNKADRQILLSIGSSLRCCPGYVVRFPAKLLAVDIVRMDSS